MKSTLVWSFRLGCSLPVLVVASPALADEPAARSPSEEEAISRARQSFLEGRTLMKEERWSAAAQAFQRAADIRTTPGLLYYVGYCQEQAGQFARARESYELSGRLAEKQPAEDVEQLLPEAISRVEGQLGRVVVGGAPPGAKFSIDGHAQAVEGQIWLMPGEHELSVSAEGYHTRRFSLRVARGQSERVDLGLQQKTGPEAADAEREQSSTPAPYRKDSAGRHPAFAPAVIGGASVLALGLGAGITGMVLAADAQAEIDENWDLIDASGGNCQTPTASIVVPCENLTRAANNQANANTMAVVGYVSAGVGATFLVLGLTVWNKERVQVATLPVPGGAGLSVSGRF